MYHYAYRCLGKLAIRDAYKQTVRSFLFHFYEAVLKKSSLQSIINGFECEQNDINGHDSMENILLPSLATAHHPLSPSRPHTPFNLLFSNICEQPYPPSRCNGRVFVHSCTHSHACYGEAADGSKNGRTQTYGSAHNGLPEISASEEGLIEGNNKNNLNENVAVKVDNKDDERRREGNKRELGGDNNEMDREGEGVHSCSPYEFDFRNGSIGNFVFTGARLFFHSLEAAIFWFSNLSHIPSDTRVIPALRVNTHVSIGAKLSNGSYILGQNNISHPTLPRAHGDSHQGNGGEAANPQGMPVNDPLPRNLDDRGLAASVAGDASLPSHTPASLSGEKDSSSTLPLPSPIERVFYVGPNGQRLSPAANPAVLEAITNTACVVRRRHSPLRRVAYV